MSKLNISDLVNLDVKKMVRENERFAALYEQLEGDQQEFVEEFIEDLKSVFMPGVTSFANSLNEMTDAERKEFKENLEKLNS